MQQNPKLINKEEIKHFLIDENIQVKNNKIIQRQDYADQQLTIFYTYYKLQITPQFICKNYNFNEKDAQNILIELLRENFEILSVIYAIQLYKPRLPNTSQIMKEDKLYSKQNYKQIFYYQIIENSIIIKVQMKLFFIFIKMTQKLFSYLCVDDSIKDICNIKVQCLKTRINKYPPKEYTLEQLATLMKGQNIFKVKSQQQQSQQNGSSSQQSKKKKPDLSEEALKSDISSQQKLILEKEDKGEKVQKNEGIENHNDKSKTNERNIKIKRNDKKQQNNSDNSKNVVEQKIKIVKKPQSMKQPQQKQPQQMMEEDQDSDCMIIEHF